MHKLCKTQIFMLKKISFLFLVIFFVGSYGKSQNEEAADTLVKKITVGVKHTPPFIVKEGDSYGGISIRLWKDIAAELGILYNYKEYAPDQMPAMLTDIEEGSIDLSINPLTVTSKRIERFNFSQPFYTSALAVAVKKEKDNSILAFLSNLLSWQFIKNVGMLLLVILSFGVVLWLVERKVNSEQFGKKAKGMGDGFWWSAVTMTTVGYGDKAPVSFWGRIIAVVWMFTSVIIISSFTGSIAASLTVNSINSEINKPDDLKHVTVGTITGTGSDAFLKRNNIPAERKAFADVAEGLEAVSSGKIDAFVYDKPVMRYLIDKNEMNKDLAILPISLKTDYYSFSAPKNSKLLKEINPVLIRKIEGIMWKTILKTYNLDN